MNRLTSRRLLTVAGGSLAAVSFAAVSFAAVSFAVVSPAFAGDHDRDGIADEDDAFPTDPMAVAEAFWPIVAPIEPPLDLLEEAPIAMPGPAPGHGTLMFEDAWPENGDRDYNDVVLRYSATAKLDEAGRASALRMTINVVALGGEYAPSLAVGLPVPAEVVRSAMLRGGREDHASLDPRRDEPMWTADLVANLRDLFDGRSVNVEEGEPVQSVPLVVDIAFREPVDLAVTAAPYDLFIYPQSAPEREIHRPGYAGTRRVARGFDDAGGEQRYAHRDGFPAVLTTSSQIHHAREGVLVTKLYPDLARYIESGGAEASEWSETPDVEYSPTDVMRANRGQLLRFDRDIVKALLGKRVSCDVDFNNAFSMLLLPNFAADTFVIDPFWFEPCWAGHAIRIDSTNRSHWHASYESGAFCIDFTTGTPGFADSNGVCEPILKPYLEPRHLDTHDGAQQIRIWASAYGQPIPFDLEGMTIVASSPGVVIEYRRSNQITTSQLYVASGTLNLNLKGVAEVLLTGQSPYSFRIEHIDAAVRVPD